MLSIVIPTLNAARDLPATLDAMRDGLQTLGVSQIVIADGGSTDATVQIASEAGAEIVTVEKGRGNQLAAGATAAKGDWLLFIHADTNLAGSWHTAIADFMQDQTSAGNRQTAAVFRFRLDDASPMARGLEAIVALRTKLLALPYGDQGLLISRSFYNQLGGFRPIPIMEDVDIIRRIGRQRLTVLPCDAVTSADRYRRDGYLGRIARNIVCLSMWFAGVSPERIAKVYR